MKESVVLRERVFDRRNTVNGFSEKGNLADLLLCEGHPTPHFTIELGLGVLYSFRHTFLQRSGESGAILGPNSYRPALRHRYLRPLRPTRQ